MGWFVVSLCLPVLMHDPQNEMLSRDSMLFDKSSSGFPSPMASEAASDLKSLLTAGSVLAGSGEKSKKKIGSNVIDVLKSRLLEFHQLPNGSGFQSDIFAENPDYIQSLTTAQVEEVTGDASLWVIDQVNQMSVSEKGAVTVTRE